MYVCMGVPIYRSREIKKIPVVESVPARVVVLYAGHA